MVGGLHGTPWQRLGRAAAQRLRRRPPAVHRPCRRPRRRARALWDQRACRETHTRPFAGPPERTKTPPRWIRRGRARRGDRFGNTPGVPLVVASMTQRAALASALARAPVGSLRSYGAGSWVHGGAFVSINTFVRCLACARRRQPVRAEWAVAQPQASEADGRTSALIGRSTQIRCAPSGRRRASSGRLRAV